MEQKEEDKYPLFLILPKTIPIRKNVRRILPYSNNNIFTIYFDHNNENIARIKPHADREYTPNSVLIFHLKILEFKTGMTNRLNDIQKSNIENCLKVLASVYAFSAQVYLADKNGPIVLSALSIRAMNIATAYFPEFPDVEAFNEAKPECIQCYETNELHITEEIVRRCCCGLVTSQREVETYFKLKNIGLPDTKKPEDINSRIEKKKRKRKKKKEKQSSIYDSVD